MARVEKEVGALEPGRGRSELALLAYGALALFLAVALFSFDWRDGGWSHSGGNQAIRNGGGAVGAWVADLCLYLFGVVAYAFPLVIAWQGYYAYQGQASKWAAAGGTPVHPLWRHGGRALAFLALVALAQAYMGQRALGQISGSGGVIGSALAEWLLGAFGAVGAKLLLWAGFLGGLTMGADVSWIAVADWVGQRAVAMVSFLMSRMRGWRRARQAPSAQEPVPQAMVTLPQSFVTLRPAAAVPAPSAPELAPPRFNSSFVPDAAPVRLQAREQAAGKLKPVDYSMVLPGELPALDLLSHAKVQVRSYSQTDLEHMARQLETILGDFGVDAEVVEIHPGPVITRFEIQPAPGIKVSRVSGLAKDLARALLVPSVRIVEIIPGKSYIGIEIPNQEREIVMLRDVLASNEYAAADSPLTLVLGKDISGRSSVANLARMPHLLVAGTTGSGKSVAVNVMILSMLYKATPDQVRLIMVDPKMLELSVYEGIPHLLTPVVTDMKEAANALRWCVAEMERRYKLMSMLGVRNIIGYNEKVTEAIHSGEPIRDPLIPPGFVLDEGMAYPTLQPLPYVVIVIDELADMMMIVGKKVEELIARLAQKARAAGLHLILATQRPSVDVITGLIKANIPTRVAFQVSSKIDSRTIIDQGGAEALLGNGDMLYLPPGTGLPMRVHGAFVSDAEVHRVVEFLKQTGPANYIEDITRFGSEGSENGYGAGGNGSGGSYTGEDVHGGEEGDPLYDEAVRFVTESRKASISSVQRRLQIGYNRAARMIEEMERAGIVGAAERNGNRSVLAPPPPDV